MFGKVKGDVLQLASVIHIIDLLLTRSSTTEDDISREQMLRVSAQAMASAVKFVTVILQQRIMFEGNHELLAACRDFWDWDLPEQEEEHQQDPPAEGVMVSWSNLQKTLLSNYTGNHSHGVSVRSFPSRADIQLLKHGHPRNY